jgi:hypothetical protein
MNSHESFMPDKEILELPLTAKAKSVFAALGERYQLSHSAILEHLVQHMSTLSTAEQQDLIHRVFTFGDVNLFPVRILRQDPPGE